MRQNKYSVTLDYAFRQVITACATIAERGKKGTWISKDMIEAYCQLHELGFAHSVECWQEDELAGGLYGISLGGLFFGESMFSRKPNSSKVGLVYLVNMLQEWNFDLIDCQMKTEHFMQFGAREIPGPEFQKLLAKSLSRNTQTGKWKLS
jgi:leucyl/phenylalanyl-tRNA--protein transferase